MFTKKGKCSINSYECNDFQSLHHAHIYTYFNYTLNSSSLVYSAKAFELRVDPKLLVPYIHNYLYLVITVLHQ